MFDMCFPPGSVHLRAVFCIYLVFLQTQLNLQILFIFRYRYKYIYQDISVLIDIFAYIICTYIHLCMPVALKQIYTFKISVMVKLHIGKTSDTV